MLIPISTVREMKLPVISHFPLFPQESPSRRLWTTPARCSTQDWSTSWWWKPEAPYETSTPRTTSPFCVCAPRRTRSWSLQVRGGLRCNMNWCLKTSQSHTNQCPVWRGVSTMSHFYVKPPTLRWMADPLDHVSNSRPKIRNKMFMRHIQGQISQTTTNIWDLVILISFFLRSWHNTPKCSVIMWGLFFFVVIYELVFRPNRHVKG